MNKKTLFGIAALALVFLPVTASAVSQSEGLFAYVAIWDVKPGQEVAFEQKLVETSNRIAEARGFYNERVLKNLDRLTYQFATYAKAATAATLESEMRARIAELRPFLRRDPETHITQVTNSYFKDPNASGRPGTQFGRGQVGQIAHLGLFIGFPEFKAEYDRTLDHVKVFTRDRLPQGYLGEDLAYETEIVAPEAQTPYSPKPIVPAKMSVNYGEYATFEDAEDSYIKRGNDRPSNPAIQAWERIFYSSLQVPTRFFIFKVIANVNSPRGNGRDPFEIGEGPVSESAPVVAPAAGSSNQF